VSESPRAIPQNRFARATHGARLPFRALGFIARHPALWPLVAAPVLLTALGLAVGFLVGKFEAAELLRHVWAEPAGAFAHLAWQSVRYAMAFTTAFALALSAPLILAAPFNDRLSQAVENRVLGTLPPTEGLGRFAREVLISVVNALARLLRFGIVQLLIFGLAFIPVLNAAYTFVSFAWSALWLAEQALDQTGSRHLLNWRATRAALGAVRPAGFAMGLVLAAVFLIPLAGLFLVPLATVSGALFYCDLSASGALPASPPLHPSA
jgi:CysZ protein